jgi:tRNA dimethylallyltransferase
MAESSSGLVLALFGPTASGKTAVAELLADRVGGEVVSADSMQVYRGLPILTNQPQRPTRLVGVWPLDRDASVAEYARLAHASIDELLAAEKPAVVAGGSGLYLRAALADLDLPPAPPRERREHWEVRYDELGPEAAHALLVERDRSAAAAVHPNDRRRVVRGLELTELGSSLKAAEDRLWSAETRHPTLVVGLDVPADVLERRIEGRTRSMFARGLQEEVRRALRSGVSATARQALGLEDAASLPEEEAVAAVALRTRRYAAYQRKWMRRIPGLVSVRGDRAPGEVVDEILELAGARELLPARRAG